MPFDLLTLSEIWTITSQNSVEIKFIFFGTEHILIPARGNATSQQHQAPGARLVTWIGFLHH
jgi:hypothetical protein